MPPDYDADAWTRLGRAVKRARLRAGYETSRWATTVGRSTRVLLGLERGEPVGDDTLRLVEETLGWPEGHAYDLLEGRTSATVARSSEDAGYVSRRDALRDATKDELLEELARRIGEE